MRILHTADWHLGHRLYDRDRTDEHRAALTWLLDLIGQEKIDVLVVAGDVFDLSNPSNQARELYYDFLGQLAKTSCLGAVIVGGNHDSPSMLDAPRDIMRSLNLHVVGAARTQVQGEVIQITGRQPGDPGLIVAAVPYLRERDVRKASFGETAEEREAGLRNGIRQHYEEVAAAAVALRNNSKTPIIATGHLFAGGASDHAEKTSYIYQADEHNIEAGHFPACFDYVALGHIHRAQKVGGQEHIRYSGSLIPLTFVEGQLVRSVRIVDLGEAAEPVSSRQVNVPYFRTLLRLNDELDAVKMALKTAAVAHRSNVFVPQVEAKDAPSASPKPLSFGEGLGRGFTPWAEIKIKTDAHLPNLRQTLLDAMSDEAEPAILAPPIELLRISRERLTPAPAAAPPELRQLDELDPEEVFTGIVATESNATDLLNDFRALRNWMDDEMTAE